MNLLLRGIVVLISIGLLLIYFYSVITTTLLNRHLRDPIGFGLTRIIRAILAPFIPTPRTYQQFHRVIVWFLPLFLFLMISLWFLLVMISMANLYWATYADTTWGQALIDSGSALSTLGFQTPANLQGHILAIIEGAMGLVIVVFLLTFVPGYQSAIEARERQMLQLYAHAGVPASSTRLLEWIYRSNNEDQLKSALEAWEAWFWEQGRVITLNPVLAFIPSFYEGQFWLYVTGSMLDAITLISSSLDVPPNISPQSGFLAGTKMVADIAGMFQWHLPFIRQARVTDTITPVTRAGYETACDRLAALGAPIKADRDESWQQFTALRSQYADNIAWITLVTMAPVIPWLPFHPSTTSPTPTIFPQTPS